MGKIGFEEDLFDVVFATILQTKQLCVRPT
jgi:hypothetical protein